MSSKQYLKNQLHVILLNILGVLALALFLIAIGTSIHAISLIALVWIVVVFCYLTILYFNRKRHLNELLAMIDQLEEKYLPPEVMDMPERAEEQVFYQILKMPEKSMLEKIGGIYRERQEYKEYIEQWVHEIKTPITAMKLMCENHRSEFTRELLVEIENVHRFTEQALYYARSEHTEKDYSIKETLLSDVIHDAIADNKYLLRKHHAGALDSHSAQMLLATIQSINEQLGATILMVTHDAFTASYADRILFLKDGAIFTELRKGSDNRSAFFEKILYVLTMIGGQSHVC